MNKRIVINKGDGLNYLGHAPDGKVYDLRKSKGGFYRIKWNVDLWVIPVGDPLKKGEFILVE